MNWLLGLLSPRVLAGLGLAIAIAAGLWYVDHRARSQQAAIDLGVLNGERADRERERAAAEKVAADWQIRARAQDDRERTAEKQLTDIARTIDHDGQARIDAQRAATGRAVAATASLRDELAATVAQAARDAEVGASAADARGREAAAETTRLLADMLGSCHKRGVDRARFADEAADAGAACQRWGEALERELNQAHAEP